MSGVQTRVVITGGAGALGVAVARAFAARGARLALLGRSAEPKELGAAVNGPYFFVGGVDVADLSQARRAMDDVAARLGGIDVLVNIAGGFRWETLAKGKPETWDALYTTNLKTTVCASEAALPHLLVSKGRIVNVAAAAAAARAGAGMGAYTASKAGVIKLTESLAEELKDQGVNVNAVLPSIIDTPANRADMPKADFSRWVAPDALAEVILFLASDGARAVTGASIPVMGRV